MRSREVREENLPTDLRHFVFFATSRENVFDRKRLHPENPDGFVLCEETRCRHATRIEAIRVAWPDQSIAGFKPQLISDAFKQ